MDRTELIQGSPEWLAHRDNHDNASDAPAVLGESPYKTRNELIKERATGIVKPVDAETQRRFDDGHRFEALARTLAEDLIGDELWPVTGTLGRLSASFDGLTMDDGISFEHKTLNDAIRACFSSADLPIYYRIQMCQQMMVSGAKKCLFMASKWTADDKLVEEKHFWYKPEPALCDRITAGWKQFNIDVANYVHIEAAPVIVAAEIEDLPALTVEMVGQVTSSNLATFQTVVLARIKAINTDIKTDEDFANAEKMVKFLDDGEKRLDLVKSQALAQTSTIDELFRTIDSLKGEMKAKRLTLDKLVKSRKDTIRIEIQQAGKDALDSHVISLNARLGKVKMPAVAAGFADAMKGKRSITSLHDAVATCLANAKIEANRIADLMQVNMATIDEYSDYAFLFADLTTLCAKQTDDLVAVIQSRIAAHKDAEQKKIDAAVVADRTRQEREAKAAAEVREQAAMRQSKEIEDLRAVAAKKDRIQAKLTLDKAALANWQVKVEETRIKASGVKITPLACPHCAGLLAITHGVLTPYEEPTQKYDAEAHANLPEYERSLALFQNSVSNGERDLRIAEDAAAKVSSFERELEMRKAA